jgi:hypothetical protein
MYLCSLSEVIGAGNALDLIHRAGKAKSGVIFNLSLGKKRQGNAGIFRCPGPSGSGFEPTSFVKASKNINSPM